MPLLKDGKPVEDRWQSVVNGDALPADGPVVVPFERWRAEREKLLGRNTPLGVRLPNTQAGGRAGAGFERLELIVLEFPKFVDGRAYSQAAAVERERFGYRHELRATENVLRDELQFMQRAADLMPLKSTIPRPWSRGRRRSTR